LVAKREALPGQAATSGALHGERPPGAVVHDTMIRMAPWLAIDHTLRAWVVTHRIGAVDPIMWGLSAVGRGGAIWVVLAIALIAMRRLAPSALLSLVLALLLASVLSDHVLKPIVRRPRPFAGTPRVHVIGGRPDDASLPSGHAANAFAGAYVLSVVSAESPAIVWWVLAGAIAYSRVYLGVHYPFDVIAGALLGAGCGALVMTVRRDRGSRPHRLR
jgi:undecaprenyl-diphosphatase